MMSFFLWVTNSYYEVSVQSVNSASKPKLKVWTSRPAFSGPETVSLGFWILDSKNGFRIATRIAVLGVTKG